MHYPKTMRITLVILVFGIAGLESSLSPAESSQHVPPSGYWSFEEGEVDTPAEGEYSIIDISGSEDHGTPYGEPYYRGDVATFRVPQTGQTNYLSLQFDQIDDYVSFSSIFPFHQSGDWPATIGFPQ